MAETLARLKVDLLLFLGGNGTMRGAEIVSKYLHFARDGHSGRGRPQDHRQRYCGDRPLSGIRERRTIS